MIWELRKATVLKEDKQQTIGLWLRNEHFKFFTKELF